MNEARQEKLNKILKQIIRTLRTQYRPEKIILFGSMVRGPVEKWSDIDLLIIKETSLPFLQRLKEVALLCQSPVSVDYLVYTPDEFAQMVNDQNPFILDILHTGKVIYEQNSIPVVAG
jgi:predicted nucleotidyltransferase